MTAGATLDGLEASNRSPSGVRVSRGVQVAIPAGGLVVHFDESRLEVRQIYLRLNLAVDWLEIAIENLEQASVAHDALVTAIADAGDPDDSLRREFRGALQAAVAAATFFEALYAVTRELAPAGQRATNSPGRGQGNRAGQVAEQLSRTFGLRPVGRANLSSVIREVYRFRGEAVHPSYSYGPPAIHPELNAYVERRHAMFTYEHAKMLGSVDIQIDNAVPTSCSGWRRDAKAACRCTVETNRGSAARQGWRSRAQRAGQPHVRRGGAVDCAHRQSLA